jgi:putative colanic acid biosynthesis UDP-glucose lipid carrier transferase
MNTAPQLASLFAAALAAYYLRFGNLQLEPGYLMAILSGLIIASIVIPATGALRPAFKLSPARVARRLLAGWSLVVTALVSMAAMLKVTADYSRIWFGYWVLFSAAALVVGPFARHIWTTRVRAHRSANRLVLVGTGQPLDTVLDRLNSTAGSEYELVAVFADDDGVPGALSIGELELFVAENDVDDVWIAIPLKRSELLDEVLTCLRHQVVDIHVIPDFEHYRLLNQDISEWAGLPFINLSSTPMHSAEMMLKTLMDRLGSLLGICFLSPLLLVIALGVKTSGPGPVFFRQKRHGFGGEIIEVLKFRTMHLHSEQEGIVKQAEPGDERITRIGSWLRRTSLDELPQLFNVLFGQMSLVGPRPHPLELNDLFRSKIPHYMLRHKVRPGMTGWSQVHGLRGLTETDEKMAMRIEYDLWYIQNWSIWLDITILARTPFIMVHRNAL